MITLKISGHPLPKYRESNDVDAKLAEQGFEYSESKEYYVCDNAGVQDVDFNGIIHLVDMQCSTCRFEIVCG